MQYFIGFTKKNPDMEIVGGKRNDKDVEKQKLKRFCPSEKEKGEV